MKDLRIGYTTTTGGAATELGERAVHGKLYAVDYLPGTTATGATITLTDEGLMSHTLLVKASAGTSNTRYYPRDLVHAAADGAALTGTSGGDRACPLIAGVPKLVVASGGSAKSGAVVLHYEE